MVLFEVVVWMAFPFILVGARARAHKVACEEDDQDKKLISS